MKQRFSSLDVTAMVAEVRPILESTRVQNIYDINGRTFLFKLSDKSLLLVESGIRFHLTNFERAKQASPSNFVTKLRKHLKSRRITRVEQLGVDRAVLITLGGGENNNDPSKSYYLLFEFFAAGNIILLNGHQQILSLFRVVRGLEEQQYSVGATFNVDRLRSRKHSLITLEGLQDALRYHAEKSEGITKAEPHPVGLEHSATRGKSFKKSKDTNTIRKALSGKYPELGPSLIDLAIKGAGMNPKSPASGLTEDCCVKLHTSLQRCEATYSDIALGKSIGSVVSLPKNSASTPLESWDSTLLDDFLPFDPMLPQHERTVKSYGKFYEAVDAFYSLIESQKLQMRSRQQQETASRRLQSAEHEHQQKITGLQAQQDLNLAKARMIEENQERVDEVIAAVNSLIQQGMDWTDINRLVASERKARNTIAGCIEPPLKLETNTITIVLGDRKPSEEESSDLSGYESGPDSEPLDHSDHDGGKMRIAINLNLSAWANARQYFEQRRTAVAKEERTIAASNIALQSARRRIDNDLRKQSKQEKPQMRQNRKLFWFEKFYWFVSTDKYLVLGAKDNYQSELLLSRYAGKGDAYVHTDMDDSTHVIIKNPDSTAPIPPPTMSQAAILSMCTSKAWDSKIVSSAWWMKVENVGKQDVTGEFLPAGVFSINGEKSFLPPTNLVLGLGVVFTKAGYESELKESSSDEDDVQADEVTTNQSGQPRLESPSTVTASIPIEDDKRDEGRPDDDGTKPGEQRGQETLASSQRDVGAPVEALNGKMDAMDLEPKTANSAPNGFEVESKHGSAENVSSTGREEPGKKEDASGSKAQKQVRGKKGKMKKLAKYADQDEEDKEMRLRLLGSTESKKQQKNNQQANKKQQESERRTEQARKTQQRRERARLLQEERTRNLLSQSGDKDMASIELDLGVLSMLNFSPAEDDEISHAIPVFAPYNALSRAKYKVKLLPGGTKKGKASQAAVESWLRQDEGSEREKALIKGMAGTEFHGALAVSKMSVSSMVRSAGSKARGKGNTRKKAPIKPGSKSYVDPSLLD